MKFYCICLILLLSLIQAQEWDQCCESLSERPPQTYTYYQNTGRFIGGEGENHIDTLGYSGSDKDGGRNNPEEQCVPFIGPLPATTYQLSECTNYMHNPPVLRPCSFPLQPLHEDEMCDRDSMVVHGCQTTTEGDFSTPPAPGCSAGCIILNFQNRIKLRKGDTVNVLSYEPTNQENIE